MVRTDPYTPPETNRYECTNCLGRFESEHHLVNCPDCGEAVRNVAVPRE
ncbi:rubrerythrin-like domain-containing protein [Halobacterium sp. R2-5]|nr:rubrerythrin-like domain-containing protein [Halobacterium sp. R2-5]NIB99492.1 rubrerythrin-like domain-containing protein [Halobacterium sp. R2-5]